MVGCASCFMVVCVAWVAVVLEVCAQERGGENIYLSPKSIIQ